MKNMYYGLKRFFINLQVRIFGYTEKQHDDMMKFDEVLNDDHIETSNLIKDIQIDETADFIF